MERTKKFGKQPFAVCHWDTFDNETFLVGGAKTLQKAEELVQKRYGDRIQGNGADRVEIVDLHGNVVVRYNVG